MSGALSEAAAEELDALIGDLVRRVRELSAYIDAHPDLEPTRFCALLKLQGELTGRVARLLRERRQLAAPAGGRDEIDAAVQEALDAAAALLDLDV